jgi:hypothetical protein
MRSAIFNNALCFGFYFSFTHDPVTLQRVYFSLFLQRVLIDRRRVKYLRLLFFPVQPVIIKISPALPRRKIGSECREQVDFCLDDLVLMMFKKRVDRFLFDCFKL